MANKNSPLGTNLESTYYWRTEYPFSDFMKLSSRWISGNLTPSQWDDHRPIAVDAQGWVTSLLPGQIARTLFSWTPGVRRPDGDYVVTYDGAGTIVYGGNAVKTAASRPGRDVVRVTTSGANASGSWWLGISATDPANYIRNIIVAAPGYEGRTVSSPFHADFLARIGNYSTYRLMQWGFIDEPSLVGSWADRPKLSDARWSTKGVPLEMYARLAAATGGDIWVSLPHLADPATQGGADYITNAARLLRDSVPTSSRIYIEWSNEVWNPTYAQTAYCRAMGQQQNLGGADINLGMLRYYTLTAARTFDIFAREFGATMSSRITRVLAFQAASDWATGQALSWVMPDGRSGASICDAVAVAPYFDLRPQTQAEIDSLKTLTVDQYYAQWIDAKMLPMAITMMQRQGAVCARNHKPMIAYEGGESTVTPGSLTGDAAVNTMLNAASRDPRMHDRYMRYYDAWRAAGGRLFCHFIHASAMGAGGRFGSLEYLTQPDVEAPKFRANQDWIAANPKWW